MKKEMKKEKSIRDLILEKINSREVLMRSKKSFVIKTVILCIVAILILLMSAVMFNFIFFTIRLNKHGYLLSFGSQGFWLFLKIFPWGLFVLDIASVIFLEWLLQKLRFGYRIPGLFLLLGLLTVSSALGFAADRATPLNDRLLHEADMQHLLSPLNAVYTSFQESPPQVTGVCNCVVTAIRGTTVSAYQVDDTNHIVTIVVPPADPDLISVLVGDSIFVAGNFHDGKLYAFGLAKILQPQAQ